MREGALLIAGYYLTQLVGLMARFGQLPDYARLHPWLANIRDILVGMPNLETAWPVLLREPWVEIGHAVPDLPMAEWSIQILPTHLTVVVAVAILLGWHRRLARRHLRPAGIILAGGGATATLLTSATLTWVACCSTPSWVVILAMAGLWIPTALSLEPLGTVIGAAGLVALALSLVVQSAPSHLFPRRRAANSA